MSWLQYIVLSFVLGVGPMVVAKQSAERKPVRLTRGLLFALFTAVAQSVAAFVGLYIGGLLRFDIESVDVMVFLGLMVVVAIRLMLSASKRRQGEAYDLAHNGTLALFPLAVAVNALLAGLAVGFVADWKPASLRLCIPVAVVSLLTVYWGVMMGRRQMVLHPRRWYLLSALFLLALSVSMYLR